MSIESNQVLIRSEYEDGRPMLTGFPRLLVIDPTDHCNADCLSCKVKTGQIMNGLLPKRLPPAVVDRLAHALGRAKTVFLYGTGEPLLSDSLLDLSVAIGNHLSAGGGVVISTNGMRLTSSLARKLLDLPLETLSVSIDSHERELFNRLRKGCDFDQVMRNVRIFNDLRMRLPADQRPTLAAGVVVSKANIDQLPTLLEFLCESGFESVTLNRMSFISRPSYYFGVLHLFLWPPRRRRPQDLRALWEHKSHREFEFIISQQLTDRDLRTRQPELRSLFAEYGDRLQIVDELLPRGSLDNLKEGDSGTGAIGRRFPCTVPWSFLFVLADGRTRLCCGSDTITGDLNKQSFEEIWNGPFYRKLRSSFVSNRDIPRFCRRCTWAMRHVPLE